MFLSFTESQESTVVWESSEVCEDESLLSLESSEDCEDASDQTDRDDEVDAALASGEPYGWSGIEERSEGDAGPSSHFMLDQGSIIRGNWGRRSVRNKVSSRRQA